MNQKVNVTHTEPLRVQRTNRNWPINNLTSGKAGVCLPIDFIPLLREDALNGSVEFTVEAMETKDIVLNPIFARFSAYLVSHLVLERFKGERSELDKSYMGEAGLGGAVIPFIEHILMGTTAIYDVAGIPGKPTDMINSMYLEDYNAVWNFRATNRSRDIPLRTRLQTDLAPAFWQHSRFAHVVPDFDQAVIDGEVALNVAHAMMPVKGIGFMDGQRPALSTVAGFVKEAGGTLAPRATSGTTNRWTSEAAASANVQVRMSDADNFVPAVYAELQQNGITVSLANIELAKKTQAFAKLREQFEGIDEEYVIDMLMDGLSIPDQALKQPIYMGEALVPFRQAKRYATDHGNLAESATSGATKVRMPLRVPRLSVGGVVVIIAEFFPEQLFERQRDPFFHIPVGGGGVGKFPEYLRDTLDPEKVDVVLNGDIDAAHTVPANTFGYAPLNWKWNTRGPRIGGKFLRRTPEAGTDEDRMRIWAVEEVNPTLSGSFYLVEEIHHKPFLNPDDDPFEISAQGNCVLNGNTVFGGLLVEATNNYDKVMEKAPVERIEKAS